jgi:DNA polymerase/3'-5' exonuclease PolX
MSNPTNLKIASQFEELAKIISANPYDANDTFRVGAYNKVANILRRIDDDLSKKSEKELMKYPGIGKNSTSKIIEFFKSKDQTIPKLKTVRTQFKDEIVKPKITAKNMNPVFAVLNLNAPMVKWSIKDQKTMQISCHCKKPNGKPFKMNGLKYKSEFDRMYTMLSGVCKVLGFDKKNTINGECAHHPFQIRMSWC